MQGGEGERRFPEELHLPLSVPKHPTGSPRRGALIHVEHVLDENLFTPRGHGVHEDVSRLTQ